MHPKNKLNDFTVKEWTQFRKSWFIQDGREKEWKLKKGHVATYPAAVAEKFIPFFTKKKGIVLDPFMGSGSTLIAAARQGRKAIGIDIYQKNIDLLWTIIKKHYNDLSVNLVTHVGDCLDVLRQQQSTSVDYILFSPPYYNTLHKSSGGANSRHKDRIEEGLDETYGDSEQDLGNMEEDAWMKSMIQVANQNYRIARREKYMTIIIQNEVRKQFNPIAWKLALTLDTQTDWELKPEQLWLQDSKPLSMTGHPKTFLTCNHHHYALHFIKR